MAIKRTKTAPLVQKSIDPENNLEILEQRYKTNSQKSSKEVENFHQLSEITSFFQTNKSKITKYNHFIDTDSRNKVCEFEGFIQLSAIDDEL